jgi:hypothetical protein
VLDVELGELGGELMEPFRFFDIELEGGGLGGGHPPADIAAILPHLVFEVGPQPHGAMSGGGGTFAVFFGDGAGPHGGDSGDLIQQGLPEWTVGLGGCVHCEHKMSMS